jgi:hypothetical protein
MLEHFHSPLGPLLPEPSSVPGHILARVASFIIRPSGLYATMPAAPKIK